MDRNFVLAASRSTVAALLCATLPACAGNPWKTGPHFYNEANHERARTASEAFAAADVSEALAGEYALMAEMAETERAIVRRHTLALRNARLVAILAHTDAGGSWDLFERGLDDRGEALVGSAWQFEDAAGALQHLLEANSQLPGRRADVDFSLHAYDSARDPQTDPAPRCPVPENQPLPSSGPEAATTYELFVGACHDYLEARRTVEEFDAGLIGRLNEDLRALDRFQAALAAELGDARRRYQQARQEYDRGSEEARRSQAEVVAGKLNEALEQMETLQARLGPVSQLPGLSGLAEELALEGAVAKLSLQQENLAALIAAFQGSEGHRPEVDGEAALRLRLAALAGGALRTLEPSGYPPLSPLLLEAERLRLRAAGLDQQLQRARRRVALLRSKRDALGRELLQLARAAHTLRQLPPGHRSRTVFDYYTASSTPRAAQEDVARALLSYANAWTLGRVPAEVSDYELIALSHEGAVDASANALAQWENLIGVPLSQLLAWHGSGIRVEDIARLLSAAGLAAIAVGVN